MQDIWYATLCVIVPCIIGLAMYGGFELWDRRRRARQSENGLPVIDYFI